MSPYTQNYYKKGINLIVGSDSSASSFQDCTESFFFHKTAIMKILMPLALLFLVASTVNSVPTENDALVDSMKDSDQSDEEVHIEKVLKGMQQYEPETDVEANNHEDTLAVNF